MQEPLNEIERSTLHVLAIHQQMRVDTRRYVAAVETATEADRRGRLQPLARWAAGFARELDLHHHIEDEQLFPVIVSRVPEVGDVLRELESDHEVVAGILEHWTVAARRLADEAAPFDAARDTVARLATELRDLLARHLDVEDELIVPRVADAFTLDEFSAWDAGVKKSLPKTGVSFAIPWNVLALPESHRAEMVRTAPLVLRLLYRAHVGRFQRLVADAFDGVDASIAA